MDKELNLITSLSNEHEKKLYQRLSTVRAELNDTTDTFVQLAAADIQHAENVGRQLLMALTEEDGSYRRPPHLLATQFENHGLQLEKRSSYYGISLTLFGVATAIFSVKLSETWPQFLIVIIFSIASLVMKWNIDKRLVLIKQLVNHLRSFPQGTAHSVGT